MRAVERDRRTRFRSGGHRVGERGYGGVVRIGACQTPEILGDIDRALRVVRDFAIQADSAEVDLLLFPECFLQGYLVTEQHVRTCAFNVTSAEFAEVLAALAGIRQTLVLGMIERSGGAYFNTALVIAGQQVIGRYRKTFLPPGESIFAAGDSYPVFDLGRVRFGINICYDTQFPQAAAAVAVRHGRVLLVPAQNIMHRDKARWWQDRHHQIRARRARETGMWLVSADVTGERDQSPDRSGPDQRAQPNRRRTRAGSHRHHRHGHPRHRPAPPTDVPTNKAKPHDTQLNERASSAKSGSRGGVAD